MRNSIVLILFSLLITYSCKNSTSSENSEFFTDPNFEIVIRDALNKPSGDITESDLLTITQIDGWSRGITNIDGIEYCENLEVINLRDNNINNIDALVDLTKLTGLSLSINQINDISALADLEDLHNLDLAENLLSDINALSSLINLKYITVLQSILG